MLVYVLDQHFSHHFFTFTQSVAKLKAEGIGTVTGKLYIGTAESVPPSELIDTTGAGDAFIGAVIYGNSTTLFYFSLMVFKRPQNCLSHRLLCAISIRIEWPIKIYFICLICFQLFVRSSHWRQCCPLLLMWYVNGHNMLSSARYSTLPYVSVQWRQNLNLQLQSNQS